MAFLTNAMTRRIEALVWGVAMADVKSLRHGATFALLDLFIAIRVTGRAKVAIAGRRDVPALSVYSGAELKSPSCSIQRPMALRHISRVP